MKRSLKLLYFGDEERMKAAEQRSADGAFMCGWRGGWGGRRKEESVKRAGASEAQGGDKSAPKAMWK